MFLMFLGLLTLQELIQYALQSNPEIEDQETLKLIIRRNTSKLLAEIIGVIYLFIAIHAASLNAIIS